VSKPIKRYKKPMKVFVNTQNSWTRYRNTRNIWRKSPTESVSVYLRLFGASKYTSQSEEGSDKRLLDGKGLQGSKASLRRYDTCAWPGYIRGIITCRGGPSALQWFTTFFLLSLTLEDAIPRMLYSLGLPSRSTSCVSGPLAGAFLYYLCQFMGLVVWTDNSLPWVDLM
jgi:hypothetical protein